MITVFDLVSGETEENSLQASSPLSHPRRQQGPEMRVPADSDVMPQLQEHRFTEAAAGKRDMPLELAQLDCEVFIRAIERG